MFPERREYPIFYLRGSDVASVRTAEPVHSRRTAEVDDAALSSPHDHPGATGPADDQTRQQVLRSPLLEFSETRVRGSKQFPRCGGRRRKMHETMENRDLQKWLGVGLCLAGLVGNFLGLLLGRFLGAAPSLRFCQR